MPTAFSLRSLFFVPFALICALSQAAHAQTVTLSAQEQVIANHLVSTSGQQRPFLNLDPILTQCARWRAQDMAAHAYFGDVGPDGYGPDAKVQQAGYSLPAWWGHSATENYIESIAAGASSPDATWSDWMNSGPHKQHLLGETSFYAGETSYGVGYAAVPGSPYTYYWVVITAPPGPATAAPDTLTIATPSQYVMLSAPQVAIAGTTSGASRVQSVQVRVENSSGAGSYQPASGAAAWSAVVAGLAPGFNTVRVQSLDSAGSVIKEAAVVVFYSVLTPVTVNASGSGWITPGFLGTTERYIGFQYTVMAVAQPGFLFTGWSGSTASSSPSLTFVVQPGVNVTANFVPNPFASRAGTYAGLLGGSQPGMLRITVGALGTFTAVALVGTHAYVTMGQLAADGSAHATIQSNGAPPITLALKLDTQGTSGIAGSVSTGSNSGSFTAEAPFMASSGAFPNAGQYTVALAPSSNAGAGTPKGHGWGMLVVRSTGISAIVGALPDGKIFVTPAFALADGTIDVYAPMYSGRGSFTGQISLQPVSNSDLTGSFQWNKPADPSDAVAPAAFSLSLDATGALYTPPVAGTFHPALSAPQSPSNIVFSSGDLAAPVQQPLLGPIGSLSLASSLALPQLNITVNAPTGIFYGTFIHPVTGASTFYQGVIFQKWNRGYGFFSGSNEGGDVLIQ